MTNRVFTEVQDSEVARLYLSGLSSIKIAKRYGVDKSSVLGALERQGVKRRTNRSLTDAEEAEIAKLHEIGGFAVYRIAKAYRVSCPQIKGALRRQGVDRKDGRFVLTEAEERKVAAAYESGKTIQQIRDEYGLGLRVVKNSLERQGVEIRNGRFFDEEEDQVISELYQSGMSLSEIANLYDLTNDRAVLNSLIRTETPRRDNRTYFFNEHAFDDLNNERVLYWIGFAYADGNVTDKTLRFGLALKDEGQLYRLRDFMESDAPVSTSHNKASIEFCSIYLALHLTDLGIVVNRGRFDLLQPHIPDELAHHFIRGYLDGDGCISINQQVVFEGQVDILTWIKNTLRKHAQASDKVTIRKRKGIHEVGWGGRWQAKRIVDYLYRDATVWLDRKRKIADGWD